MSSFLPLQDDHAAYGRGGDKCRPFYLCKRTMQHMVEEGIHLLDDQLHISRKLFSVPFTPLLR